jgi:hypothetical protein
MYFKITLGDPRYIALGMVDVKVDFYLEEGDEGWAKYNSPEGSLNSEGELNPFCEHFMQFDADMLSFDDNGLTEESKEAILWCCEWALGITHKNYLIDDLHCQKGGQIVNQDIDFLARVERYKTQKENSKIIRADVLKKHIGTADFTKAKTVAKYSVK